MDLDALTAARRDDWDRLAQLAQKSSLSGNEADELIDRYQAGASDLSTIRTTIGSSAQGEGLSLSLSRARRRFTGTSTNVLERITMFFVGDLPAALYRVRWLTLAIVLGTAIVATAYAYWLNTHPGLLLHLGTAAQLKKYANESFIGYYSAHPDPAFAGQVWTHNATLAAVCIASGITGVFPIYFLVSNAMEVGQANAILTQYGSAEHFWLYIAPHGQLELYSVFVAGAAGLMVFWAWVAPGKNTRIESLASAGRSILAIVIGQIN